jgi:hypothetical protein
MRLIPPLAPITALRRLISRMAGVAALLVLFTSQVLAEETRETDPLPGKRVALVIGNGGYDELGVLPNPPNDASDIAEALKQLSFEVSLVLDGDVDAMRRALRQFGRSATGADVALFYYAGHGMALNGENYLVPVKAQIETELDLGYETLGLADVRDALDFTDAKLKMVILDACRDNPLAKLLQRNEAQLGRGLQMNEGLAPMDVEKASGMFIAYATAPGNVAFDGSKQRNSPFTKALLAHIATPNTDVRVMFGKVRADVLKATNQYQTPWTEEAMLGEFQFNPVSAEPAPPTLPPEYIAWNSVAASEDPADLEGFLKKFPDSTLAGAARDRLKVLSDPATELAAWTALQTAGDIPSYEKFLRRYPKGAFAIPASVTLQGLLWAQLAASQDVTGMEAFVARFPNAPLRPVVQATLERLRTAEASAPSEPASPLPEVEPADEPAAAPAPSPSDELEVALAPPTETPEAKVAEEPEPSSERALTLVAPPATGESVSVPETGQLELRPAGLPPEMDLSPASVDRLMNEVPPFLIQIALAALDYYHGRLDGQFGPASRRAAAAFQKGTGVPATGVLQPGEVVALIAEAARSGDPNSQNVYGGMFETGAGVTKDPSAAATWYRLAAEADNGYAQMNLGLLYMRGVGVDRDPGEARRWLEAALENGIDAARERLSDLP